jgi:exodeoxyribonuclease V alpha subunit
MNFDATQQSAIDRATSRRFSIINGGAGTGKTTIIREICRELTRRGESVILCAFAGKAAARLREATGFEASTIHSALGWNGARFALDTLSGVSVVMDESSMVNADLLAEIIRRNPARLILVGDQAQLPPVGTGQPFHDLIAIRPDVVSTLETCYRNSEAVFQAAMQIRAGIMPPDRLDSPGEHWRVIQYNGAEATHAAILDAVTRDSWDFDEDVVLCVRNGDGDAEMPCSVKSLNRDIVKRIRPRPASDKFRVDDRVILTKNFPKVDCWNGSTGKIHAIDSAGCAWVRLDSPCRGGPGGAMTELVLFTKPMMRETELAYALTVHKSQGSQYRNVIVVCLERDLHTLLDRAMIYTAVTRTRRACAVMGQKHALNVALRDVGGVRTVIQELAKRNEKGE